MTHQSSTSLQASAQVLILGTHHFDNPGRDVVQVAVPDVLLPEKQAEIAEVVDALISFQPTKIAIEMLPASAATLDNEFANYCSGSLALSRSERHQLGFRVAARLAHPRLYPIDDPGRDLPFEALLDYAQQHTPGFVEQFQQTVAEWEAEDKRLQQSKTVRQILRHYNTPQYIAHNHSIYLTCVSIGAGDTYIGADLLAAWYHRNIRIFANLQHIVEPSDNILVIFGAGHTAILRELVNSTNNMELIDPLDYL